MREANHSGPMLTLRELSLTSAVALVKRHPPVLTGHERIYVRSRPARFLQPISALDSLGRLGYYYAMQTPQPDNALIKQKMRQQALAKRQSIAHAAHLTSSEALANHFADHPMLGMAASFAGYHAVRGEIDVLPVFKRMARYNKPTALPRINEAKRLDFHLWRQGDVLERDALGISVPSVSTEKFLPELVLVPLLAFDSFGNRLGYGGGYYDRTMAHLRAQEEKPPLFVGVAFSSQEVEYIPSEAHDATLDGILTELGVSMFNAFGI